MPFLDLLPARRIHTDLAVADKQALIAALASLLSVPDADEAAIRESLLERERLGDRLGRGVPFRMAAARRSSNRAQHSCGWPRRSRSKLSMASRLT